MAEQIRMPIVGEDVGATRVLKDVAREAGATAAATRILADEQKKEERAAFDAAAAQRILAESYDKGARAAAAAAAATVSHTKADRLFFDSMRVLRGEVTEFTKLEHDMVGDLQKGAGEMKNLGNAAKDAAGKGGLGALAGAGGGAAGGGMAGLIAAGVALAPVLVTVGTGLGGLGLAALAAGKNSKQLKTELAPLKDQFQAFGKSVQPVLLQDFAAAAHLAGGVLKDIRPVTIATGKAMAQFLGLLGKDFQGQEWQQFFQFMGTTAAPDVQLLGKNFIDLANTLPPLLKLLQPTATDLLSITDALAKAAKATTDYTNNTQKQAQHENFLAQTTDMLRTVLIAPGVGLYHALQLVGVISSGAAKKQQDLGTAAHMVAGQLGPYRVVTEQVVTSTGRLGRETNITNSKELVFAGTTATIIAGLKAQAKHLNILAGGYEHALTPLENYINAELTQAGDLSSLNAALKLSHDRIGFNTQAQRNSFAAAQTYIDNTLKTGNAALAAHKGIQGQIDVIEKAIPKLEQVKGKTADYKRELDLLKGILDKLRAERRIDENVVVTGTGTWHQANFQSGVGHAVGPAGAAGAFIRQGTTATADDVIARVSKGELIVPANMVASGMVDHLRGSIPGFAAGGIISDYHGSPAGLPPWTSHNQKATVSAITAGIAESFAAAFKAALSGGFMDTGARSGSAAVAQSFARSILGSYGWGPSQFPPLVSLWNQESGWNAYAVNPSSGAYGIPQALGHGHVFNLGDYKAQIIWGLNYIRSRYGSPGAAEGHELAFHWYDRGGYLPTGLSLAYNGTGRPEPVVPGRGTGTTVNNYVTVQVGHGTHPVAAAKEIAALLNQGAKSGVKLRTSILGPG